MELTLIRSFFNAPTICFVVNLSSVCSERYLTSSFLCNVLYFVIEPSDLRLLRKSVYCCLCVLSICETVANSKVCKKSRNEQTVFSGFIIAADVGKTVLCDYDFSLASFSFRMYLNVGKSSTTDAASHAPGSPKQSAAKDAVDADAVIGAPLTIAGRK